MSRWFILLIPVAVTITLVQAEEPVQDPVLDVLTADATSIAEATTIEVDDQAALLDALEEQSPEVQDTGG